jgi:hypothetical protein
MAQFEISIEEYRKWNRVGRKRTWKFYLAWAIAFIVLVGAFLLGQYAFGVFWACLLIFIYMAFIRMAPRIQAMQMKSPFAFGPFDVILGAESYTVRVGCSELRLSLQEFLYAHDFGDHFRLDHASGCHLYLPKRALNEEETQVVDTYRQRYPGLPERRPWELITKYSGITRA